MPGGDPKPRDMAEFWARLDAVDQQIQRAKRVLRDASDEAQAVQEALREDRERNRKAFAARRLLNDRAPGRAR